MPWNGLAIAQEFDHIGPQVIAHGIGIPAHARQEIKPPAPEVAANATVAPTV
jgi:hypothetical protein